MIDCNRCVVEPSETTTIEHNAHFPSRRRTTTPPALTAAAARWTSMLAHPSAWHVYRRRSWGYEMAYWQARANSYGLHAWGYTGLGVLSATIAMVTLLCTAPPAWPLGGLLGTTIAAALALHTRRERSACLTFLYWTRYGEGVVEIRG